MLGDGTAEIVGRVGDIRRASLQRRAARRSVLSRSNGRTATASRCSCARPAIRWRRCRRIRTTIRQVEPDALLFEVRTLSDIAAASAAVSRLAMRLLGGFAVIALVLAAVGIYGVMSYSVRRRTRELGTRLALGASRRDIVGLVMRQAAAIAGAGPGRGRRPAGWSAARALSSMLYGVPPWDPLALGAAGVVLTVTALGASYLPARRAARVDPATTLTGD